MDNNKQKYIHIEMNNNNKFIFGFITGFLLFYWSTRLCGGTVPLGKNHHLGSIIISLGEDIRIHVHHWIILLIILLFAKNIYLQGFCVGGILQGLTFPDWHRIVYRKNKKEKMIGK